MPNEIKLPTDIVNLVNPTEKKVEFHFDGEPISISPKEFVQLQRAVAEHGIRQTSVMGDGGHRAILEIEELPEGQRTKEGMSRAAEELVKSQKKVLELANLNATLAEENKSLREKIEKLERKLART